MLKPGVQGWKLNLRCVRVHMQLLEQPLTRVQAVSDEMGQGRGGLTERDKPWLLAVGLAARQAASARRIFQKPPGGHGRGARAGGAVGSHLYSG